MHRLAETTHEHDKEVELPQANWEVVQAKIPYKPLPLRMLEIQKFVPKEES